MSFAKAVLLTTQNSNVDQDLTRFVESVCGESHLRIEEDFGDGFVRLKRTEAEKRQAAQDIQSSEDIVIELLRNARDAHARHIYIALNREESKRTIVVIDDGEGIPPSMHEHIFEPRVTSKLDTASMDKWGMHGRGMALYSIATNATDAHVARSHPQCGSSIFVETDLLKLKEKKDQSTFPRFEPQEQSYAMRGPRNIMRTACEFVLEHRDRCNVYCGSFSEIAATLYAYGLAITTPQSRAYKAFEENVAPALHLACASDPADFSYRAAQLGLTLSERSARRIMDGDIEPLDALITRLECEAFPQKQSGSSRKRRTPKANQPRKLSIAPEDLNDLSTKISRAFEEFAEQYYLNTNVEPRISYNREALTITIPIDPI